MGFKSLVNALAKRRGGIWLLDGIASVLVGVERLMTVPAKPAVLRPQSAREPAACQKPAARANFFSIKRTKSELGFTFWVLQGHGAYPSFELFDTWAEAMFAAESRLLAPAAHLLSLA
jgi:hypothetical protein